MGQSRVAGYGLVMLGVGSAIAAMLGPLVLGVIDWRVSPNAEHQIVGGDAVTLALMAPIAVLAGVLWLRGNRLAPVLAFGPALYSLYTFTSLILGVGYDRYDGNSEAIVPLLLVLVILGWMTAVVAWQRMETPTIVGAQRVILAVALLAVGTLFALAWSQQIAQVIADTSSVTAYVEDPMTFWVIRYLDLAFVMPVAILTGIGLLLHKPFAMRVALAAIGFLTFMSAAVSAMGVMMLVRDDPSATIVFPIITVPLTIMLVALATSLYRGYLRNERDADRHLTIGITDERLLA